MLWYGLTSVFVTAMTMRNDAVLALEEKNFQPLSTQSAPSGRVSARMRFGHRIAGEDLTLEQWTQVALVLGGRAVMGDGLRVPRVGGLTAENDRRPRGSAQNFVEQSQFQCCPCP